MTTKIRPIIKRLEHVAENTGFDCAIGDAIEALEAQAQRIEWLEEAHRKFEARCVAELKEAIAVKELAATRIAELERENRRVKNIIYAYEAVRAALKRKRDD